MIESRGKMANNDLTKNSPGNTPATPNTQGVSADVFQSDAPPPPPPTVPPIPQSNEQQKAKVASNQPQAPTKATSAPAPPKPKRKFPKFLVIIFVVAVLAAGLYFAAKLILPRFMPQNQATLTWWGLWEDESVVKPLIAEYENGHPNVKINYELQSPQDYRERLTNALAKGNGPDIFRFHNTWVPMFSNELDSIPASIMSSSDYAQSYYPVIASDMASGTGIVGVPLGYDALTLYVNEDIFERENVAYPTTWVEVREAAKILTKKENDVITQAGVALGRTENVDHWPEILALMMLQNGVSLSNPTGKLAEDALTFYTLFSTTDGVWDETLPASTTAFANGKLAMYFGTSWRAFEIKQQNPDLKFNTIPLPQLPKEKATDPDISYASYWVEGVWERSPNKDVAWDFLNFIGEILSNSLRCQGLWRSLSKKRDVRSFAGPTRFRLDS
jgi:multiple sugar transport system substrate-binding protein